MDTIIGLFSIVVGVIEGVVAILIALGCLRIKGNETYQYHRSWAQFAALQLTLGIFLLIG